MQKNTISIIKEIEKFFNSEKIQNFKLAKDLYDKNQDLTTAVILGIEPVSQNFSVEKRISLLDSQLREKWK